MKMVDVNLIYKSNSDYLRAEDIGNQMVTYTINSAELKEFDNGDRKLVLHFAETDKSMPLNVTNARAVADMYGPDSDAWINRRVMLFTIPVEYNGKMVQGLRVRAPQQFVSGLPEASRNSGAGDPRGEVPLPSGEGDYGGVRG